MTFLQMEHTLIIRKAAADDLEALQEVFITSIMSTCHADYSEQQLIAWTSGVENRKRWTRAIESQYFLVAVYGRDLAGFGSLEDGSYVDFMFMSPRFQGKGIARQIFQDLEAEALRLGRPEMTANVSKTARPFFERQGFTVVRTNENLIRGVKIVNYHMKKVLTR